MSGLNVSTQVTTFAHSMHVAKIAKVLLNGVLKHKPELLKGVFGYKTTEEVLKHKRTLRSFIYEAGMIHDIGKNIVKVMLENYGYDVIDLGKDVPPELIVDTAIKEDVKLVGLSALMTTTVVSMEDTIKLLKEKKPDTFTVVGGAVMTQEYADRIGADCYAKDAMETVRFADKVFGGE